MSKTVLDSNGGVTGPNEPLLITSSQSKKSAQPEMKILDEKDVDGAVYKSTVDKVELNQGNRYVGLSKEELELYVHDPFWRKMRMFFLALFWLAWIGMFAAAIGIVISSPKCPPKPKLAWFEKKMCYQIWTRSFQDSDGNGVGDVAGITQRLKQMVSLKASAIWPVPLLSSRSGSGYDVKNHREVAPELGTMADLEKLIKTAHDYDMSFIMDLPLTLVSTDHEWFTRVNSGGDKDFFIWSDSPSETASKKVGDRYYRHWGTRSSYAILNWEYAGVRRAMKDVAKFWLDKGVDGFYLGEVQYISLKADGKANWDVIHEHLKDFTDYMRNNSNGKEILTFTSGGFDEPTFGIKVKDFKVNMKDKAGIDYVINNELIFANGSCGADCLHEKLKDVVDHHKTTGYNWPMWEVGHPYVSRLATRMGSRARAEQIMMLLMSLPGSVNIYYGDEIGMSNHDSQPDRFNSSRTAMQWSDEAFAGFTTASNSLIHVNNDYKTVNVKEQAKVTNSPLKMFRRLAGLRRSEDALLYGTVTLAVKDHNLLLMDVASNYSTTIYLTILNTGKSGGVYNLTNLIASGKDCSVVTMTTNLAERQKYKQREAIDLNKLELQADEALVVKMKPAK